jgi:hypothetical protein
MKKSSVKTAVVLNSPIRAYKFKAEDRNRLVNEALADRVNAAFKAFGIPSLDDHRWERLGWALLCEVFPDGFAILEKPRGGDKKKPEQPYADCAEKFEAFLSKSRHPSRSAAAIAFLRKNSGVVKVGPEAISNHKALLRAVRRGNAELQRRLSETVLIRYAVRRTLDGATTSPLVG